MATPESTPSLQRIPFHDDELFAIVDERTGKEYVLPKRVCDIFHLKWPAQHTKLTKSPLFSRRIIKIVMQLPDDPQVREVLLLERGMVDAWLMSISVKHVAEDLRDKLLRYQEECAAVLNAYFTQGKAINPRASALPTLHDPAYEMLIKAIIDLDATRHQLTQIEQRQRAHDRQLLATQAKTIEALMTAQQANTKAGLALEEARRYTIEEWVLHNGLLRQVPPSLWKEMSTWLRTFCQTHNLKIEKAAVPGKIWAEENTYPLVAFGAWLQHDRSHARQIALVTPLERDATPSEAP